MPSSDSVGPAVGTSQLIERVAAWIRIPCISVSDRSRLTA